MLNFHEKVQIALSFKRKVIFVGSSIEEMKLFGVPEEKMSNWEFLTCDCGLNGHNQCKCNDNLGLFKDTTKLKTLKESSLGNLVLFMSENDSLMISPEINSVEIFYGTDTRKKVINILKSNGINSLPLPFIQMMVDYVHLYESIKRKNEEIRYILSTLEAFNYLIELV